MKKLLVVGDSYMSQDKRFPGGHWSEMTEGYEVINAAQPGSSNAMVALALLDNLEKYPDIHSVVIGGTSFLRVEFKNHNDSPGEPIYYTGNHAHLTTPEQKKIVNDSLLKLPHEFKFLNSFLLFIGLLSILEAKGIKFAFSLGLLEKTSQGIDPQILKYSWILERFNKYQVQLTLVDKPYNDKDPLFHIADQNIQKQFANEVMEILNRQTLDK